MRTTSAVSASSCFGLRGIWEINHVDFFHATPQYGNKTSKLSFPCFTHQQGSPQVDAGLYGDVVGGLQEGPLQDQSQEEKNSQDRSVLQQLSGGHEVHIQIGILQKKTHTKKKHSTIVSFDYQNLTEESHLFSLPCTGSIE